MNDTIGAGQVSQAWTTLANTSAQPTFIRRYLSEPLGVNTFGSGALSFCRVGVGLQESSTNSTFAINAKLWIWRPSTGSIVATLSDVGTAATPSAVTTEQWLVPNPTLTAGTSADGDVLVVEIWRSTATQSMATAYTNTFYYDGATVPSLTTATTTGVTDAASLVYFCTTVGSGVPIAVQMSAGVAANPPYRNPMVQLLPQ